MADVRFNEARARARFWDANAIRMHNYGALDGMTMDWFDRANDWPWDYAFGYGRYPRRC